MERFFNKVAVVTGASSGIGAAVVLELLRYKIAVVGLDVNEDGLQVLSDDLKKKTLNGTFSYKKCDVSKKSVVEDVFKWIDTKIGSVAILVNSAGVLIRTSLLDANEEDITKIMDVNVKGLLLCCQEAMKLMIKNEEDGHLININSINGHHIRTRPDISSTMIYAASKHSVTVLTEGLRQEIMKRNLKIKCTSISPGHVETPLSHSEKDELLLTQILVPKNVADVCIAALNTPPFVLISELIVMGIHQEL